jgi:uncharacterized protein
MKTIAVIRSADNTNVFQEVEIADNLIARLRGLLGRSGLASGQGILLRPANSIHTIGMKFPIDIAFIDRSGTVIKIVENMPPGRFSPIIFGSVCVLETTAGEIKKAQLNAGDNLRFESN